MKLMNNKNSVHVVKVGTINLDYLVEEARAIDDDIVHKNKMPYAHAKRTDGAVRSSSALADTAMDKK
jgi:hypothetical protein